MKLELVNVRCENHTALNRAVEFISKVSQYPKFDTDQMMYVYVDKGFDLIGFESEKYSIQWVNNKHKLSEVITTPYYLDPVPFWELKSHILSLCKQTAV